MVKENDMRQTLRKILVRVYKLAEYIGNTIVNKIPISAVRKTYYKLLGAKFEKPSKVFRRVEMIRPQGFRIGKGSSVGWFSLLDCRGGIQIGNNVTVASYCKLITAKHNIEDPFFRAEMTPIKIEDYAWICTGAIILSGVTIGQGAVVCAGAVVTKSIPPMTVWGGVPARFIKQRTEIPVFEDDMKWSWLN